MLEGVCILGMMEFMNCRICESSEKSGAQVGCEGGWEQLKADVLKTVTLDLILVLMSEIPLIVYLLFLFCEKIIF